MFKKIVPALVKGVAILSLISTTLPDHAITPARAAQEEQIAAAQTAPPAPAAQEEHTAPERAALRIQEVYAALSSLSFDFQQLTITSSRERSGKGHAVFYRPDGQTPTADAAEDANDKTSPSVMRWDYTDPDIQVIINDGATVSIYSQRDKQMIITPATELESDITYRFLAGNKNLLKEFKVEPDREFSAASLAAQNLRAIRLLPLEPHSQIRELRVVFDNNFLIQQLFIEDHFDSITHLLFSGMIFNTIAPGDAQALAEIINFQPPADTEIISR